MNALSILNETVLEILTDVSELRQQVNDLTTRLENLEPVEPTGEKMRPLSILNQTVLKGKHMSEERNIHMGVVSVDSGQLVITDPCYIESGGYSSTKEFYDKLSTSRIAQINHKHGNPGLAVKLDGFGGDGVFDVFGHYNEEGLLTTVTIDLTRKT